MSKSISEDPWIRTCVRPDSKLPSFGIGRKAEKSYHSRKPVMSWDVALGFFVAAKR